MAHEAHHFLHLSSISQFYHMQFLDGDTVNLPKANRPVVETLLEHVNCKKVEIYSLKRGRCYIDRYGKGQFRYVCHKCGVLFRCLRVVVRVPKMLLIYREFRLDGSDMSAFQEPINILWL